VRISLKGSLKTHIAADSVTLSKNNYIHPIPLLELLHKERSGQQGCKAFIIGVRGGVSLLRKGEL
jgi:hypothetical protein